MFNLEVITKDSDIARKLLVGSLLALTGVGLFALLGWAMEIMRRIDAADDYTLPDFDDIGTYFIDGLKVAAVALIWALPVVLLVTIGSLLAAFAPAFFADPDDAALLVVVMTFCIVGLVMIAIIPLLVLLIPAMGVLSETGSIRDALSLSKNMELARANLGGFLIAGILGTLVNSALGSIGAMLCLVGIYPALFLSYTLQGQLFGAAYRDAKANLAGAPIDAAAEV